MVPRGLCHLLPRPRLRHQPVEALYKAVDIALLGQEAGLPIADNLRNVAVAAAHDRHTGGRHLDEGHGRPALGIAILGGHARRQKDVMLICLLEHRLMGLISE